MTSPVPACLVASYRTGPCLLGTEGCAVVHEPAPPVPPPCRGCEARGDEIERLKALLAREGADPATYEAQAPTTGAPALEAEAELLEHRIDADGDAMAHEITRRTVLEALVREMRGELYERALTSDVARELLTRSRELVPDTRVCPGCTLTDPVLCLDCARDARVR